MSVFLTILLRLIPLYLMIILGYIVSKGLKAQKETIAKLLIYILIPSVSFYGAYTTEINFANLSLPILFFILSSLLSLLFLAIGKFVYKKDSTKNLLAFAAGSGNFGFFGLPVVLAVLGEQAFSLAAFSIMGFALYQNTLGFYIVAKGNYSAKESLMKVIRLPMVYTFIIGLMLNFFSIDLGDIALTTLNHLNGAYILLGMMIIGMGLSKLRLKQIDVKFISLSFLAKFIVWPLAVAGIIFLDKVFLHLYDVSIYNLMIVMAIVPLAVNLVTFAIELKVHSDKAALAVLLSTLFALFYIPLATSLFIP